jgi:CheY-like chemotaxis protein
MGLGLAIVRRLTDLLGHPLEMASRPGRGSRFSLTVPRAAAPRRQRAPPARVAAPTDASAPASRAFAGRHVVVIDDDPAVVAAMRALFGAAGATVTGAADAAAAREALAAEPAPVELIVADLRLADGACGIAAVATLRDVVGAAVPALIVSGDASETARTEARAANLTLLPKPLAAPALLGAARAALAAAAGPARRAAVSP